MIIEDDKKELLKQHLISILEPICDADPDTLADYVIALLSPDIPDKELKNLINSQLEEFLKSEKSSDLKRSRDDAEEQKEDSDQSDDDRNFKHKRITKDNKSSSHSTKPEHEEQTQPPNKKIEQKIN
ncbi:hypothetical protein LY90DRAFT_213580 [Neocallimastix californiae]|uniref:PWI domain-containing protein n=1 Tax=Neocallimastix californiae TaxID=1754190 RepID=A0A1Y2EA09_9FUNG|nr:hypothetical protein LY90DRAFT_213580 [Neocallimastix californiae]|eukprot:ORY68144.1 hypothetical protein LY90DRAFT_213580 [Neocallimastix californiae]